MAYTCTLQKYTADIIRQTFEHTATPSVTPTEDLIIFLSRSFFPFECVVFLVNARTVYIFSAFDIQVIPFTMACKQVFCTHWRCFYNTTAFFAILHHSLNFGRNYRLNISIQTNVQKLRTVCVHFHNKSYKYSYIFDIFSFAGFYTIYTRKPRHSSRTDGVLLFCWILNAHDITVPYYVVIFTFIQLIFTLNKCNS